jgi:mitochondrial pyruvate carrier 2
MFVALAVTGLVWSRYSLVITPKNYALFSVNFLLGVVGCIQGIRALHYQYTFDGDTISSTLA